MICANNTLKSLNKYCNLKKRMLDLKNKRFGKKEESTLLYTISTIVGAIFIVVGFAFAIWYEFSNR